MVTRVNTLIDVADRISWRAILAGTLIAVVLGLVLNLLGLAFGLESYAPNLDTLKNIQIGIILWMIISGITAIITGAWVSAYLSGHMRKSTGALHGILTWCLASILTLYFFSRVITTLISGTIGTAGNILQGVGQSVATLAPHLSGITSDIIGGSVPIPGQIKKEIQTYLTESIDQYRSESAKNKPLNIDEIAGRLQTEFVQYFSADEANKQSIREVMANILVQEAGVTRENAQTLINDIDQRVEQYRTQAQVQIDQAQARALQLTEDTSDVLGDLTLSLFFALLISGIAAIVGGILGSKQALKNAPV